MGTLIDRFEEHDGPVRSVAFHPTQNIFVSGGDDYKIRLWSLQSRKSIAVLSGAFDPAVVVSGNWLTFTRSPRLYGLIDHITQY
jgi:WD40 repeat protein